MLKYNIDNYNTQIDFFNKLHLFLSKNLSEVNMEKIKDFIYEKSDVFFAGLVVVVAGFIVLYNLNGWLFIDGENSKYTKHKAEVTDVDTNTAENTNAGEGENTNESTTSTETVQNTDNNQNATDQNATNQNTQTNTNQDTQSNSQTQNTNQNNANQNTQTSQNTQTNTSQNTQNTNQTSTQNQNTQANANQNTQNKGAVRNITIAPGSTAKSIANALKNNGLISDEKEFVQKLINSGNDTKLKAGTFSIKQGSTQDEIIAILIKNPK